MINIGKPRNARSKRAAEKREAREFEAAKRAMFVRGSHSSEKVSLALTELAMLKKPNAISFQKRNDVVPFEDASSLEFWGKKNDASLFVLGNHQKKRPNNLTWVRLFDGGVLDMYEMGIVAGKGHSAFSSKYSPSIGARPLFHFSGPNFATDDANAASLCTPGQSSSMQHIKSMFLDFFRGEELPTGQMAAQIALRGGLQHIICVTEEPLEDASRPAQGQTSANTLEDLYRIGTLGNDGGSSNSMLDTSASGRTIHFRVYAIVPQVVGQANGVVTTKVTTAENVQLEEIGPSFDFVLRRRQMPSLNQLNASLKRPKLQSEKSRQGKAGNKKNIETDDVGDMVARVHVGKQDLSKLQTRKMKGLKRRPQQHDGQSSDVAFDDDEGREEEEENVSKRSRRQ